MNIEKNKSTFDLQRFAVISETFENVVYTLTTDKGTLKLSGLYYKSEFNKAGNFIDVSSVTVAKEGLLTVVENSTDCTIRL